MLKQNLILGCVGFSVLLTGLWCGDRPVQAQRTREATQCSATPQDYLAEYQKKRSPLAMVCYQYVVQQNPTAVPPVTTAQVERKTLVDVYGKKVPDKQQFDEVWQPLPGFEGIFYDAKTLSKYYTGGRNMLQIPGTSTLGDNLFKVSITVDCDNYRLDYTGVARRLTRIYDYSDRYQIPGNFPKDQVQQLCYEMGEVPAKIGL